MNYLRERRRVEPNEAKELDKRGNYVLAELI